MGKIKDTAKFIAKAHPIGQAVTAMQGAVEHQALLQTSTPTPPPPPPTKVIPTLPSSPLPPPPPNARPMNKMAPAFPAPNTPSAPRPPLTLQQKRAVVGAEANRQRPVIPMTAPKSNPVTPFTRPEIKMKWGGAAQPPTPTKLTPKQEAVVTAMEEQRARLSKSASKKPTTRTQTRQPKKP